MSTDDAVQAVKNIVGPHLSDAELAQSLGIERSTISRWRSRGLPKAVSSLLPFVTRERVRLFMGVAEEPGIYGTDPPRTVRHRRLAEFLSAVDKHWEALGTEYARNVWLDRLYRDYPELKAQSGLAGTAAS